MTQEEQRISIAKACGWEFRPASDGIPEWHRPDGSCCLNGLVPDYPQSLDAMHEAEKTLSGEHQIREYIKTLAFVRGGETYAGAYLATAPQRAEAFLKTIGKWKDSTTGETEYEKAVDALHYAARDFTLKWLKAPKESSFNEWFNACEVLEQAAVNFAKAANAQMD